MDTNASAGHHLVMNPTLLHVYRTFWLTGGLELVLALGLSLIPRCGGPGRRLSEAMCRAPMLDILLATLTWLPWPIAAVLGSWPALVGALAGQAVALLLWTTIHELIYRRETRGPRIVTFLNRTVGRWRNYLALALTLIALPGFWLIRVLQIVAYWPLIVLLDFPRYRHAEWINVSRHKFEGLVGHDLVWCLYCDWMTGVYCLGAEMLRNVESFWCPIRFYEGKKCANCAIDFPDLADGWIGTDKSMADVVAKLSDMYSDASPRAHFHHPARLTPLTVHARAQNPPTATLQKTQGLPG